MKTYRIGNLLAVSLEIALVLADRLGASTIERIPHEARPQARTAAPSEAGWRESPTPAEAQLLTQLLNQEKAIWG
jgi:hypothetical protein